MQEISIPDENNAQKQDDETQRESDAGSPPPPDKNPSAAQPTSRKSKPVIATTDECLAALTGLPKLAFLGLAKPGVVNAMRNAYKDILDHHRHAQQAPAQGEIANDDLLRMLRENPQYLELLEPFLSDEQIQMLMKGATDEHGEA